MCVDFYMEAIMEPERARTPEDTRLSHACRTSQCITAVVYLSSDTLPVV